MTTTALANWYGSNRMLAKHVGEELAGCSWVGIPFAGGMCEVPHIGARQLLVNDLHRHVINLARVVKDQPKALIRRLSGLPFHPDVLAAAQARCIQRELHRAAAKIRPTDQLFNVDVQPGQVFVGSRAAELTFLPDGVPDLAWAEDYFVCTWMTRGGKSGTKGEFQTGQSFRWDAGGGGSNRRYRSAIDSVFGWSGTMQRCEFRTMNALDVIAEVKDADGFGLYCDSDFPGPGDLYAYGIRTAGQPHLAAAVSRFKKTRVVMRYYEVPLVRELFPEGKPWTYVCRTGRAQSNKDKPEILILNGPSRAGVAA
jgi:hypothetical protein